jgi:hypothetical protein
MMHSGNDMSVSTGSLGNGVFKFANILLLMVALMLTMLASCVSEDNTGNVETEGTFLYGVFLKYDGDHVVAKLWRVNKGSHEKVGGSVLAAGVHNPTDGDNLNWNFLETSSGDDYYGDEVRPLLEEFGVIKKPNMGVINDVYDFLRYLDTLTVGKDGSTEFGDVYLTSLSFASNNKSARSQAAFRWFSGNDSRPWNIKNVSPPDSIIKTQFEPLRENDLDAIDESYRSLRLTDAIEFSQSKATINADQDPDIASNDNKSVFSDLMRKLLLSPYLWLVLILLAATIAVYLNRRKLIGVTNNLQSTIDDLQIEISHQKRILSDFLEVKYQEITKMHSKLEALAGQPKEQPDATHDIKHTSKTSSGGLGGARDLLVQAEPSKGWKDPGRSDEKEASERSLQDLRNKIETLTFKIETVETNDGLSTKNLSDKLGVLEERLSSEEKLSNEKVSEVLTEIDTFRKTTRDNFNKLKKFHTTVELEQIERITDIKQSIVQKSAFAGLSFDLFESWFKEHPQLGEILTDEAIDEIKSKLQHLQNETQVLTEQKRFAEALIGFCNQKARGDSCKAILPKLRTICEQADGIQLMINEGRWDSGHLQYLAQLGLDTDENATSPLNQFATALATFVLLAKDPEGWIKKQSSFLEESVVPQLILMTFGDTNEITNDSEGLVTILQGAGMEIIRPTKGSNFEEREHEVFGFITGGERGKIARIERPGLMNSNGGVVLRAIVELFE